VYVVGPLGHFHRVDRSAHAATWSHHLLQDFGGSLPHWAASQSPLLYEGHLHANSNGNKARDGFVCLDLEGKLKWRTGNEPSFDPGSMLLADGLIFAVNGQSGLLAMIEPSPAQFRLPASAPVLEGGQAWAPLALIDGLLLVRDQRELKCFDVRAAAL
jgi:outer membrane protein assembly factor BamB